MRHLYLLLAAATLVASDITFIQSNPIEWEEEQPIEMLVEEAQAKEEPTVLNGYCYEMFDEKIEILLPGTPEFEVTDEPKMAIAASELPSDEGTYGILALQNVEGEVCHFDAMQEGIQALLDEPQMIEALNVTFETMQEQLIAQILADPRLAELGLDLEKYPFLKEGRLIEADSKLIETFQASCGQIGDRPACKISLQVGKSWNITLVTTKTERNTYVLFTVTSAHSDEETKNQFFESFAIVE